jgi:hypothetical protein
MVGWATLTSATASMTIVMGSWMKGTTKITTPSLGVEEVIPSSAIASRTTPISTPQGRPAQITPRSLRLPKPVMAKTTTVMAP